MSDLKPCPVCGSNAKLTCRSNYYRVSCFNPNCPVRPRTASFSDKDTVISFWNDRFLLLNSKGFSFILFDNEV